MFLVKDQDGHLVNLDNFDGVEVGEIEIEIKDEKDPNKKKKIKTWAAYVFFLDRNNPENKHIRTLVTPNTREEAEEYIRENIERKIFRRPRDSE